MDSKPALPNIPLSDRVINLEAMVLGFAAEHGIAFNVIPEVLKLTKALAVDKKALDNLNMNRTTASYKTRFGVAKTFDSELVETLRTTFFSLNMDESTSSNFQRVVTILVSFFSPKSNQVEIHHLSSFTVTKVNSQTLFDEVVRIFDMHNIPWSNLMSILMDSCNVMRGSKSGLETRIRNEKAPHLLDVDGDICHHIHNASKAFCKQFDYVVESLFTDLFNDFKWSADLRESMEEVCLMLGIKFTMPQRYISHRWLSVYDVTIDMLRMFDAYTLFYYSWVVAMDIDKAKHMPVVVEVYHRLKVTKESRDRVNEIMMVGSLWCLQHCLLL